VGAEYGLVVVANDDGCIDPQLGQARADTRKRLHHNLDLPIIGKPGLWTGSAGILE
jgi:hypothetical protein